MMTIDEMIALLEQIKSEGTDGDTEVRLAIQPSWPFEHRIAGASVSPGYDEEREAELWNRAYDEGLPVNERHKARKKAERISLDATPIVYIVEGGQLGYTSATHWDNPRKT